MIGALRDTKKKKKFIILLAVLLFALIFVFGGTGAVAEEGSNDDLADSIEDILGELDTEELQKYLDSLTEEQKQWFGEGDIGDKILSIINGDFSMDYGSFLSSMAALVFDGLDGLLSTFCVICAITILCGILSQFRSSVAEKGTGKLIFFVGYSSILVLILTSLTAVIEECYSTVGSMQKQMQAVFPVLLTLIATSGGSVSVAVYQPAVLFLSEIIVRIISGIVFPLAVLICVLNMAGNMSSEIKLKNFSALFKSIIKWVLGISLTAFTVFLTVQGITSATYDGLSFKAAKYAISNSVPIIGGFLGSGFDLIVAGSVLIKNSLGSCSILLLAGVIFIPFVQLIVYNLFLKLTAAVTEPVGDARITEFFSSLSGTVNYFTAGLLAVGFMYFITILLLVCSSNSLF
ncbi:MAG TPA: stage III sporulation protein AE [Candidatus Borkfalkia excrementavium]|uniref:Stage III sporulation protein AE n=1 Tax=Candidatus Borkfalkia excrementavium TaxID=2838505 RepID=A0A9D1Z7N1_9FIRM|nr:stage III sporulation protein AE [Candidatus Borkfalkia excrementavium]